MDYRKIVNLTTKQAGENYREYVRMKSRLGGEIYDFDTWRATIETYLDTHASPIGRFYSKTAIRDANYRVAQAGHFTGKQLAAIRDSYRRGLAASPVEGESDISERKVWNAFRAAHPNIGPDDIGKNARILWDFLQGYSGNWNQYFNS